MISLKRRYFVSDGHRGPLMDANGDGIGKYRIYQLLDDKYHAMGSWSDGQLQLDVERVRRGLVSTDNMTNINTTDDNIPLSVCSVDCEYGKYRAYQDQTCCWTCIPCDITTSIIPNNTMCIQCPLGFIPNTNLTECEPMQLQTIEWTSMWAIAPAVFAAVGIVFTLIVVYVFIRYDLLFK